MGDTRDKNAGSPSPPALPPPCPHPDPEGEQGVSCPFPVALSCGIWAIQASPLKTLIQRQERGRPERGYFYFKMPFSSEVCSSLLSLGPGVCTHHALWHGSGMCQPAPLYRHSSQRHGTVCVCAGCGYLCIWHVSAGLYTYMQHARKDVCICANAHVSAGFCV